MKVAVIGAGASGIFYAILRKKQFPQDEVILVDKEDRLGKKIYVTGNGRCNLFHEQTPNFLDAYSNYKEAEEVFTKVPLSTLKDVFSSLGLTLTVEVLNCERPILIEASSFIISISFKNDINSFIIFSCFIIY